jgi:hypothetical protein
MLSSLIFKAEMGQGGEDKGSPLGTTRLIYGLLKRLRTRGSDHTPFYYIQLYKIYPDSRAVAVDTEMNKAKLHPWGCCVGKTFAFTVISG